MARRIVLATVVLLCAGTLSACENVDMLRDALTRTNNVSLLQTSSDAADRLAPQTDKRVTPSTPVRASIITDIDHPNETTPLGTQIADQVAARFAQLGYNVQAGLVTPDAVAAGLTGAPVALSSSPAPQPSQGAFKPLIGKGGDALIGGHFTRLKDRILINLRVTQGAEQRIIAAYDYTMLLTDELRVLALSDAERRGAMPEKYHDKPLTAQPITDSIGLDPPAIGQDGQRPPSRPTSR